MRKISLTNAIIIINIAFFLLLFIPIISTKGFVDYIALKPSNILQGKYLWTLLTSIVMHADLIHLFVNMVSLFFIGNLVEKLVGTRRYLWIYILSGLFAGIFFIISALLSQNNLDAYAVGASGAIFGLGGILMFLTPNLPVYLMFIPIPIKMKYAIPILLIALWAISLTAGIPIGNTAHLGGLLIGMGYGLYLRAKYKKKVLLLNKYFQ